MVYETLRYPELLTKLICDLDGIKSQERGSAYACIGPSVEDPGRQRMWIIPKDLHAGANPSLWVR